LRPIHLKLNNLDKVIRLNENEQVKKTQKFFQKTRDGKQLLRDMMRNYIPHEIINAEKQGFSSPDASWFKGESIDFVKERIFNKSARIYDLLDRDSIQGMVQQHLDGKQNRRLLIWSLLNVEELLQQLD
jgi:asparagine synthase (glutamine-hydrolysing)